MIIYVINQQCDENSAVKSLQKTLHEVGYIKQ
jgi:hypothetical protein